VGRSMARVRGLRREKRSWGLRIFFVFLVLLAVGIVAARLQLTLIPPHVAFAPAATLSPDKKMQLDDAIADAMLTDRERAIDLALDFTGRSLSFSLWHKTSLDFGAGSRGGNCVEYAELFVAAFDVAAKRVGSTARAYRVRSEVRVFGKRIPLAAFANHDWVLVTDPADGARIYLDPTFYDAWLGASIARNVKGGDAITLPK
jgi:hypothetical protein